MAGDTAGKVTSNRILAMLGTIYRHWDVSEVHRLNDR